MSQILMSYENPNGYKLEELIDSIINELTNKNNLLKEKLITTKNLEFDVLKNAVDINQKTIELLTKAKLSQENVMTEFSRLGDDLGPTKPRVMK